MARRVSIVPHTHWDREWYAGFQSFRLRLVHVLDDLLARMDADPTYSHFMLDGQMAVIDDYLAVRPASAATLTALAVEGRLSVGPWYVLMDEFLVSGETIIRDLQLGLAKAEPFGGAMEIGYLPDMFGHIAQMPQLLSLFGFQHAVVWRGVPSAIDRTAFWWQAPDGSTVRAEYLPTGYGNGAAMPDEAADLLGRLEGWEAEHAALLGPDAPILWMNGSDHHAPQGHLGAVVAEARPLAAGRFELAVTTLAAHLAASPTDGLPSWSGELRSGAHANLLMGVTSNRTDVRQAAARAERALERIAEPLAALLLPADEWPQALLDEAWLQLIRNAAHDSVCACSIDPVVDAVLHRYAEAEQIAEGLTLDALAALGPRLAQAGPVAVNSTGRTRSGLVTVKVVHGRPITGGQLVGGTAELEAMFVMPAANAVAVLGEILDWTPGIASVTVEDSEPEVRVEIDVRPGRSPVEGDGRPQAKAMLAVVAQADPARPVRAIRRQLAVDEVLVRAADVPAFGWAAADPAAALSVEAVTVTEHETHAIVANGLVTVEVGPRATFAVNGIEGFGRIVDEGDAGDTYNWCPPDHDLVVTGPETVHWRIVERGPLRARVEIEATYIWPARHDDASGRRVGERATIVVTTIEIQAGDPLVRVTIAFDNQSDDHRVRVWLPLPQPAVTSRAECAFTVVERGLEAEGGPTEVALATFPSRRFVAAGGLTVVHEGLPEYELVDRSEGPGGEQQAHAVALTLLRATGWLSRGPMTSRPLPAGPVMALRGSQVHGPHELRFALQVTDADAGDGDGDPASDPYDLVDAAFVPLLVTYGHGVADGVATPGQALALTTGAAVVSSVTRRPGGQQVRLFNPTAKAARIEVPRPAVHVDLRHRPIASIDGVLIVRPEQIVTVVVADATI